MKKIIFVIPALFLLTGCGESSKTVDSSTLSPNFYSSSDNTNSSGDQEEISDIESYNEEENKYESLDGTHTVEACNTRTGSCYDLDADISDGQVENIQFPNGGHLDLDGAELDEDGQASGESYTNTDGYDGDEWEINCEDCE
jgi:hypothetical protein